MPYDITMCTGGDCTLKSNCLRFTGAKYGRQDFFGSVPYNGQDKSCEYLMDDRPKESEVQQYAYQLWQKEGRPVGRDLEHWFRAQKDLLERNREN
jgi:hypothetical protein